MKILFYADTVFGFGGVRADDIRLDCPGEGEGDYGGAAGVSCEADENHPCQDGPVFRDFRCRAGCSIAACPLSSRRADEFGSGRNHRDFAGLYLHIPQRIFPGLRSSLCLFSL